VVSWSLCPERQVSNWIKRVNGFWEDHPNRSYPEIQYSVTWRQIPTFDRKWQMQSRRSQCIVNTTIVTVDGPNSRWAGKELISENIRGPHFSQQPEPNKRLCPQERDSSKFLSPQCAQVASKATLGNYFSTNSIKWSSPTGWKTEASMPLNVCSFCKLRPCHHKKW
jgi:hypothetical protein